MTVNSPFLSEEERSIERSNRRYTISSHYIPMRDNVEIALDVLLPKNLAEKERVPAILIQTRYWRSIDLKMPFRWLIKYSTNPLICKHMVKYKYAIITVDVRGTGASYGNREYPVGPKEINDGAEIIDWITSQPWSNGEVVTWGNSYTGMTSELALSVNHQALKGAIIKHNPWDFYAHAIFPGGCFNKFFTKYWSSLGAALDQTDGKALLEFKPIKPWFARLTSLLVRGVKPVDSAYERLEEVAQIHLNNSYPMDYARNMTYRDDPANEEGLIFDDISIFNYQKEIEESHVPMFCWGSWLDSATPNMVIERFLTFDTPQKAVIGDWDHEGHHRANPYFSHKDKAKLSNKEQIQEWIRFYDECLKEDHSNKKILYYYTMGEEKWKKTTTWPPAHQQFQKWYLREDNFLRKSKPYETNGEDSYRVDFNVTTGIRNRWYTLLSVPVNYYDRKEQDKRLLTYTSDPLEKSIEITGHPIVTLYLSTSHKDGMVAVYLEYLDENDKIHFVTDGQIRFMHRKISKDTPYEIPFPYHSCKKEDAQPVVPNELMELKFALYPTSILLKKGFRIRLAIAGADKESFARYPSKGVPDLTIKRDKEHSSFLRLPVIQD
ncbi:MAG: CocE/NonD family hydrolase [Promethearchaeia archaeon]